MYTQVIYQFGDVLPNGATIVECKVSPAKQVYVLATSYRIPTQAEPNDKEWITWAVDEEGNTFYGHYTFSEKEARNEFERRIK